MKIEVEALSTVKKILHVEIPKEKVTRELDTAYKELRKTAKIKGFRPGKAPRAVLENFYRKGVNEDVTGRLIQESFPEAVKEVDLKIVGRPQVDPSALDEKGPYKYAATVEINPEIADVNFKDMELEKTRYTVTDTDITGQLEMLQKNLLTREPIEEDRPLQKDDVGIVDYEAFQGGAPFADIQKAEKYPMKIGTGQLTEDFDDQLIGMNPGDNREVVVTFPDDSPNTSLAGQEISFQVTLGGIEKELLPEIDDELAKKAGEYQTLDELKAKINDNLKQGYDKRVEQELNEQIFKALISQVEFELPDASVAYELNGIIAETERSLYYRNTTMEDMGLSREMLEEQYRETAEKQARRHLILDKIISQEALELSDEELEDGYGEMAGTVNQTVEEIKTFYSTREEQEDFFKHGLLEKKAINLIIEHGRISEVEPKEEPETEKDSEK